MADYATSTLEKPLMKGESGERILLITLPETTASGGTVTLDANYVARARVIGYVFLSAPDGSDDALVLSFSESANVITIAGYSAKNNDTATVIPAVRLIVDVESVED